MNGKKMLLRRQVPDKFQKGKWILKTEEFEVIVMSIVDKYAMVRRPRCFPFIANSSDLYKLG